ncbi:MAG: 3-oxoacid CoA-transferase subunit A [Burkholderiaceae bacterium]
MLNKVYSRALEAVSDLPDGATVLIGGFSGAGVPELLITALIEHGAKELTVVHNNAGNAMTGVARLLAAGQVRKVICSFPRSWESHVFESLYRAGKVQLECVPQGTLAERLRAGGSGLGPFFTPTGYGTELADGKETRVVEGRGYVLEQPLRGDFALVKARRADRWGNLQYRMTARNFGPAMCMAGGVTIVEVDEVVPLGTLDPETIVTSAAFVQRIVSLKGANP